MDGEWKGDRVCESKPKCGSSTTRRWHLFSQFWIQPDFRIFSLALAGNANIQGVTIFTFLGHRAWRSQRRMLPFCVLLDLIYHFLLQDHVMVSGSGHACIGGFGFAIVRKNLEPVDMVAIYYPPTSWPWMAPELI